jgi:hypothetical protein
MGSGGAGVREPGEARGMRGIECNGLVAVEKLSRRKIAGKALRIGSETNKRRSRFGRHLLSPKFRLF